MLRKTRDETKASEEKGLRRFTDVRGPLTWFDEMDRWFDEVRREFEDRLGTRVWPWRGTGLAPWREPLADLTDEGREFVLKADLPGVSKDDLDIAVTEDGIELSAQTRREAEEKEKDYYFSERSYSSFRRTLPFPAPVLPDQAEATLKDGVLEVRVPKKEPTTKSKPVKVRVT